MSIKIYDGHIYRGSIYNLLPRIKSFAPTVIAYGEKLMDTYEIETKAEGVTDWWAAWNKERTSPYRDSFTDTRFEITMFPLSKRKTLLLPFYGSNKILTAFREHLPEVQYYGYWNNTDPDKECSSREWRARRRDWEKALPGVCYPSNEGLTISLHLPHGPLPRAWRVNDPEPGE